MQNSISIQENNRDEKIILLALWYFYNIGLKISLHMGAIKWEEPSQKVEDELYSELGCIDQDDYSDYSDISDDINSYFGGYSPSEYR